MNTNKSKIILCECSHVCRCMLGSYVNISMCVWRSEVKIRCYFSCSAPLLFETVSHCPRTPKIDLLTNQQVPRMYLSLLPQGWDHKHVFTWVKGNLIQGKHFIITPSLLTITQILQTIFTRGSPLWTHSAKEEGNRHESKAFCKESQSNPQRGFMREITQITTWHWGLAEWGQTRFSKKALQKGLTRVRW